MTKKEYESFHYFKEINRALKDAKLDIKLVAEKNEFKDWSSKWSHNCGNLPDSLKLIKKAKDVKEITIKAIREKEIAEFMRD